jgi:tetratricopeptide (TPR) repeat protein
MAGSLAEQGRFDEAIANLEEAERRFDSITAEDHPTRASIAHNMATVRWMQGDYARAVEGYRKAIAIRRRLGMKNDLAAALIQLGKSLIELERYDEAEEALKEADAIDEELFADRGVRSGGPLLWLAKIARVRGDLEGAREYLERARSFDDDDFAPRRVEVAWLLGSTLWELGVDKPRAHALVEEAQRLVQESPRGSLDEIGEHIDAWLSEHSTPK